MKYILITGGCISGIGKGVIASSIGKILKNNGYEVTAIKIDPYLNRDAGTFSPYEHGEVFVLDDGGEVDLDLGNYERLINIKLHQDHNITTGKMNLHVDEMERAGKYLGKTVRIIPHYTEAIKDWIERVATKPVSNNNSPPEICIIELGGTVGDMECMPFVEALRQLRSNRKKDFCSVHVSMVLQPRTTGDEKTKPTQESAQKLSAFRLKPDIIICRSKRPISESSKEKISFSCEIPSQQIVSLPDVQSVYHVPIFLEDQGLVEFLYERLGLQHKNGNSEDLSKCSRDWRNFSRKVDNLSKEVKIALVDKYIGSKVNYAPILKALQHAAIQRNKNLKLKIVSLPDVQSVYHVPIFLEDQGKVECFYNVLGFQHKSGNSKELSKCSRDWRNFSRKVDNLSKEVNIALVGKYTGLKDSYASVTKALQHAAIECNRKLKLKFIAAQDLEEVKNTKEEECVKRHNDAWENLRTSDGIIVPGGFGVKGMEGKIAAIEYARKYKKPFLGICLGFQLAVVEVARHCVGWGNAHTAEITQVDKNNQDHKFVVIEMPEHHTGKMGGTMRLGNKQSFFNTKDSILWNLYGKQDVIEERHRHRYEVDKSCLPDLERAGLRFVAEDKAKKRLEILELAVSDHPYFVAVQFHPEYISRPMSPSPPYLGFILASCNELQSYLNRGCQFVQSKL